MLIGAPPGYPPELESLYRRASGVTERESVEIALIERGGIPAEFAKFCRFWPGHPSDDIDMLPVLRVGGNQGPARSRDELEFIVGLGVGLDLDLQPGFDLGELEAFVDKIPHLTIRGGGIVGWETLAGAVGLRSCNLLAEPPAPINLDMLPNLTYAFVLSPNAAYVASVPSLTKFKAHLREWPPGLVVGRSVRRIEIWESRKMTRLPPLQEPSSLVELDLRWLNSFDLASLLPAKNLRSLSFGLCRRLLNAEALLELPALEYVFFGAVKEMPGWQNLQTLRIETFSMPDQKFAPAAQFSELSALITSHP